MIADRLRTAFVLFGIAFLVSGTKACQEDYCVGCNAAVGTITPTVTPTDTSDDGVGTPTPTATPTDDGGGIDETPTPTPTGDVDALSLSVRRALKEIGRESSADGDPNWLGAIGNSSKDSDGDGFTDAREDAAHTDPSDPSSAPAGFHTNLARKLEASEDRDGDGLSTRDELKLGLNPSVSDSDGDGCSDGAEALSGSNPLDALSRPSPDDDRDCLSNGYEKSAGLDPRSPDTDKDAISDAVEVTLGADALNSDTDGDGILDWKELKLGTDPRTADF